MAANKEKPAAEKDKDKDKDSAEAAPSTGGGRLKFIVIVVVVVLASMGLAGGGVFWYMQHPHTAKAAPKLPEKALYYAMDPPFTVTMTDPQSGNLRYMQAAVTVMTRHAKVVEDLKSYDPELRNNLNQLFSSFTPDQVISAAGREMLERRALAEINRVLAAETGRKNACEEVLFTAFVVQ